MKNDQSESSEAEQAESKSFIWVSKDFSCLGFALKCKKEGHNVKIAYENDELEPEQEEAYGLVGEGLVECVPMEKVFKARDQHADAYWVFDSNHLADYSDALRQEGFKVWGSGELCHKLEHDRGFGVDVADEAGFDIPYTEDFTSVDKAIAFLEKNADKAYVCKPNDDESYLTYVPQSETPESANKELRTYLKSMDDGSSFILQQVIRGVEVDVEVFVFQGKPYFAWVDLECKRRNSGDKGSLIGCSQNISFIVPLDSPLVQTTIAKMYQFCEEQNYTGFADVNVILSDNKVYFLEWTWRYGFSAHPTLFFPLLIAPLGETFAAMIDGKTENFYDRFRKGFAAGVLMYIDNPRSGYPLHVSKDVSPNFYHYECCSDSEIEDPEQDFYLAGFGQEVGVVFGHNYSLVDAAKKALANALLINYPACAYREDLDQMDFPSSPIKRHEALDALGMFR
jgi:phosphoribosylamine-glycine ligase